MQNFVPKKGTAMADAPEPPFTELLWTIAVARLLFGAKMNIQAPPNLTPGQHYNMSGLHVSPSIPARSERTPLVFLKSFIARMENRTQQCCGCRVWRCRSWLEGADQRRSK